MKPFYLTFLLLLALTCTLAHAQAPQPANATTSLPQLTLSPNSTTGMSANAPQPTTAANIPTHPALTPKKITIPEDPAAAFTAGVAAYNKNNFAEAQAYFAGAEKKAISPALEFDLGNACYQSADYGGAILHYLRVLALSPRDPDALQNLALARKGANIPAPDQTRLDHYAAFFTRNTWAWLTSLSGWIAVYLAFFPRLYRWRGLTPWCLCFLFFAVAVGCGLGLWGTQKHAHDGVVLLADTPVNISPTSNSQTLALLQPGEISQSLEQHGDYYKIRTTAGLLGWVHGTNFAMVEN